MIVSPRKPASSHHLENAYRTVSGMQFGESFGSSSGFLNILKRIICSGLVVESVVESGIEGLNWQSDWVRTSFNLPLRSSS